MLPASLTPPCFDPGSVWLVGAGPGDPGLLTLHAAHALSLADVVLHDALVSPEILTLAPQAHLELAGKRAGGHRTPQLRINQRLIHLARQGRQVVRLKGGDPLIFGRGGEEALALAAAGVPFRIVPGISAGIGGTAAAGIPLTHRRLARSVAFATGHDTSGGLADLDWAALGRGAEVLVLYMAQRQIGAIAARLIEAGRDPADAVALISDATTPRQTVHTMTLARAASLPSANETTLAAGSAQADGRRSASVITSAAGPTRVDGRSSASGITSAARPTRVDGRSSAGGIASSAGFAPADGLSSAGGSTPSAGPALIVIGPVVALRPLLADWQQTAPMTAPTDFHPARAKG